MQANIPTFPARSITKRGNVWIWRRHCVYEAEYRALQAYRGSMSGEARRRRNRDRNRLIVRLRCALGMKYLAVAAHCRVSVATAWRVVKEELSRTEARRPSSVPDVLRRLLVGVVDASNTHFMNRLTRRKVRDVEGEERCRGIGDGYRWESREGGIYGLPPPCPPDSPHIADELEHIRDRLTARREAMCLLPALVRFEGGPMFCGCGCGRWLLCSGNDTGRTDHDR